MNIKQLTVFLFLFSGDSLLLAVDIEYEIFKKSKSSNLYKAAVLKQVIILFWLHLVFF